MTRAATGSGALLVALLLVALNLRGPITAPAPVLEEIAAALALTPGEAGWLTGLPVLCFATLTPLAAVALARAGTTRMLAAALLAILLGTLLRSFGGTTGAFAGTVVIGAAVTVGNVGVPTVIARDFPTRVPRVMGLYSALMTGGAGLTTLGTAPLAAVVGWRWALATWGLLVVVALVVWVRVTGPGLGRRRPDDDPLSRMMEVLTAEGYTAVLGTNCEQTYDRYLRVGERPRVTTALDSVVGPKRTAMGEGYFVTSRNTWYVDQEKVATMLFRVLKFIPAQRPEERS